MGQFSLSRTLVIAAIILINASGSSFLLAQTIEAPRTQPAPAAAKAPTTFFLDLGTYNANPNTKYPGYTILYREIARQAVLLAARDGLGLVTRDAALREPVPRDAKSPQVNVSFDNEFKITILPAPGSVDPTPIWQGKIDYKYQPHAWEYGVDWFKVLPPMETFARTELVDALKKAGYQGQGTAPAWRPEGTEVPNPLAMRMLDLPNQYAQLIALREIHAQIATSGQTPGLIIGLARGYCNLAMLTHHHFSNETDVFMARGLIYAQRAVALAPKSPEAFMVRAYALTVVGHNARAVADIKASKALIPAGTPEVSKADWTQLVEPFNGFRTDQLDKAIDQKDHAYQFAAFMKFVIAEGTNSYSWTRNNALATIMLNSLCFRAVDYLSYYAGIDDIREATEVGPMVLYKGMYKTLLAAPDQPEAPMRAFDAGLGLNGIQAMSPDISWLNRVATASDLLIKAAENDVREPSWAVFARGAQEDSFLLIFDRAYLLRDMWGWTSESVRANLDKELPLVHDHPYSKFLEIYRYPVGYAGDDAKEILKSFRLEKVGEPFNRLINLSWYLSTPNNLVGEATHQHGINGAWDSAFDDAMMMRLYSFEGDPDYFKKTLYMAKLVLHHGPDHPMGIATLINSDEKQFAAHATEWETKYSYSPTVLYGLAVKYKAMGKLDDAERCINAYLGVNPDFASYEFLAGIFERRGDRAGQIRVLEKTLSFPDNGLNTSRVGIELCNLFMQEYDLDNAWKYALRACNSRAEWAMLRATEIAELREDLTNSEKWIAQSANHYQGSDYFLWYSWCMRNNQGNVNIARRGVEAWLANPLSQKDESYYRSEAVMLLLEQKEEAALPKFETTFKMFQSTRTGLEAALCAMSLKQNDHGKEWLVIASGVSDQFSQIAALLVDASAKPDGLPDREAIDRQLDVFSTDVTVIPIFNYIVGRYYELHGQPQIAVEYYKAAVSCVTVTNSETTLASISLRKQGIDPMKIRTEALVQLRAAQHALNPAAHRAPAAPR